MLTKRRPTYIPESWETIPCPFCFSTDSAVYEKFGSNMQYTYVTCNNCGLIYQSPRPTYNQHFIDAAYADYYQYAEKLSPEEFNDVPQSGLAMFKEEVAHLLRYDIERNAVLDIGSGMGTFLLAAQPHYKKAIGLDVSEKMASFIKTNLNITVLLEPFETFTYPTKFTTIHMSHVIEHVPHPNQWLQHAKELLAPSGILVVNVPNKYSFSFRLQHLFVKLGLKKQFSSAWSDPGRTPDHLFEPTVKAMLYLFKKNRFKILEHFSYSRKDPVSNKSFVSRLMNRKLFMGSNLSFIVQPQ